MEEKHSDNPVKKKNSKLSKFLTDASNAIKRDRYVPKKDEVGIDLSVECNLRCPNCEAGCRHANVKEYMSLEQIEKFVKESLELKHKWDRIKLRGGEPTLHPQFFQVLDILKKYKDKYPKTTILIQTNNTGKKVKDVLSKLPKWTEVLSTNKEMNIDDWFDMKYYFNTYSVAPVDRLGWRLFSDFTKRCWRIKICHGIGLSRHGYYLCSPGATVDRIFGCDVGIKNLKTALKSDMKKQSSALCRYCGHFKEPNDQVKKDVVSRSWKKAFDEYNKKKPELSLY